MKDQQSIDASIQTKRLLIHIGPHKTGSSSLQRFLRENFSPTAALASAENNIVYFEGIPVLRLAEALTKKDWDAADEALERIAQTIEALDASTIIISNENLSGGLVGRGAIRRVYPRLFEHLKKIHSKLAEHFDVSFYFFLRNENDWFKSVYAQNLTLRNTHENVDAFRDWVRGGQEWSGLLSKVRQRMSDRFIEIPYTAYPDDNVITRFMAVALPEVDVRSLPNLSYWDNKALDPATLAALEAVNANHASPEAKRAACQSISRADKDSSTKTGFSDAQTAFVHQSSKTSLPVERKSTWPQLPDPEFKVSEELSRLWQRVGRRVHHQEQPNLMPDIEQDLTHFRIEITSGETDFPGPGREDMKHQTRILKWRLRDKPLLCYHNALAISYLRRSTPHTDHARALFHRLWEEEYEVLLGASSIRWLISSLQTFMEHGRSEEQRLVGSAGYFLANTMKAYEAERAIEGLEPDAVYPGTKPTTKNGFLGLDRFRLGDTDLMLNVMAMTLEIASRDAVAGRILQELLLRLKTAHTVFSRMDNNRVHHEADVPGFLNCWSFADPPFKRKR